MGGRSEPHWKISLEDNDTIGSPPGQMKGNGEEMGEFDNILLDIGDIVTTLYQLSIAIRNPIPRDRLHKIAAINVSHFEIWDIQHIAHKFPEAPKFLKERLGKANTKRRQIMKYYRKHHDTIAQYETSRAQETADAIELSAINKQSQPVAEKRGFADTEGGPEFGDAKGPDTTSTVLKSQTTVSAIMPATGPTSEAGSNAGYSNTSFATSANPQTSPLHIPPPPNFNTAYDGQEFECPYCFQLIRVSNLRAWR